MKINTKQFIIALALPLGVGALAAWISRSGMAQYQNLNQPPLAPPGWLFPIVWTILYLLMGYSSYRIYTSGADSKAIRQSLCLYGVQLLVNFLWPLVFFGLQWRLTAFFILLALWLLVFLTMRSFSSIDEKAGDLLIPYLLWITFAGYLNLGVFLRN